MSNPTLEEIKAEILTIARDALESAPDLIADLKVELEDIAAISASYGIKAMAGDPAAKDVLDVLLLRAETIAALIAERGQDVLAAVFQMVFSVAVQGLVRGLCLALGVRFPA